MMSSIRSGSTFLPEVENTIEAIKLDSTAIGICTPEGMSSMIIYYFTNLIYCITGVVFVVAKCRISPRMVPSTVEQIVHVDKHIGYAISGLIIYARTLIECASIKCLCHWLDYNESVSIETCVQTFSSLAIQFSSSGDRPCEVGILFADIEKGYGGPQLGHVDPSESSE